MHVVVVGAGVSGLVAGLSLQASGIEVTVVEARDVPGGRVRSREQDGYVLDEGFQVLLTAYPGVQRWLDLQALRCGHFLPGAFLWRGDRWSSIGDPFRRPSDLLPTAFSPMGSLGDKFRVLALRKRALEMSVDDIAALPDCSTLQCLTDLGFTRAAMDRFFRPFLGGIFLESELDTSQRMFWFVWKMFSAGSAALPAGGMQAISWQLAGRLRPASLRLSTPVETVRPDGVTLAGGEVLHADSVVLAADPISVAQWFEEEPPLMRSCVTHYFAAPSSPLAEPRLALNASGSGQINHVAVVSDVGEGYAPPGKALVSVTHVGRVSPSLNEVRRELRAWFGTGVEAWEDLDRIDVPAALPALPAGQRDWRREELMRNGLWIAGDGVEQGSLDGAIRAGERVAEGVKRDALVTGRGAA